VEISEELVTLEEDLVVEVEVTPSKTNFHFFIPFF
jgi:hypothetical protein